VENSKIEWTDHTARAATGRQLGAYKSAAKKVGCSLEEWFVHRAEGRRRCFRCHNWKRMEAFSIDRSRSDGRASSCKLCTSAAATASHYSTTRKALADMLEAQEGRCPICLRRKKLVVDHNHETQEIRGLICNRCNVGMGQFKDDALLLRSAAAYLERVNG
jgi:hypothetical protein